VSTLEADAARLSEDLESLGREEESLAPLAAEVELAEQDLESSLAARAGESGDLKTLREAQDELRDAERARHRAEERAEALERAAEEVRGSAAIGHLAGRSGVLGSISELLDIDEGFHLAVEAALGAPPAAVVVDGDGPARSALEVLAGARATGTVVAVVTDPPTSGGPEGDPASPTGLTESFSLPQGAEPLAAHVRARNGALERFVERALSGVLFVKGGWRRALEIAMELPQFVVVDDAGDRFCGAVWTLSARSSADTVASAEAARRLAAECASRTEQAHDSLVAAQSSTEAVAQRLDARRRDVGAMRRDLEVKAAALSERRSVLSNRLVETERRLAGHSAERARAAERRMVLEADASTLDRLDSAVERCASDLAGLAERVSRRRSRHLEEVRAGGARLDTLRHERSETDSRLGAVRERLQRLQLEVAELGVRYEASTEALRREMGAEPEDAKATACPPLPEGVEARARASALESELATLGPINPLALEELGNLEERHRFLEDQIDDVRRARRELHQVIRAVDDEIVRIFADAFADVNEHFQALVATLFPGSTGRLTLTEPSDILETGVEVEARPAGKNVRKLSLLSGGERSLVALAFLFAVFRSRPSPFYLLDEVEAALDDVNLHRFLDLLHEFRGEAQLIIVSHQKRTMEAADALYGVTMTPGGSSKVVSQKVSREIPEDETTAAL
jgi:chromosome segregation protein